MHYGRVITVGRRPPDVFTALHERDMWASIGLTTAASIAMFLEFNKWQVLLLPVLLTLVFALANHPFRDRDEF